MRTIGELNSEEFDYATTEDTADRDNIEGKENAEVELNDEPSEETAVTNVSFFFFVGTVCLNVKFLPKKCNLTKLMIFVVLHICTVDCRVIYI